MKQFFNHANSRVTVRLGIITTVMLVFLFVVSGTVFCASAEEGGPSDDFVLEETMVTATKTGATNIQKTAISITALDTEALKDRKQTDVSDLSLYSPNVSMSGGSLPTIYIRGVGNNNTMILSESAVAVYIDGMYQERGYGASNSLFDVARIEVLRGPQGTLYGRNATGGAINIVTNEPGDELEVIAAVEIGKLDRLRFDAVVSGPIISDKLKARITVSDSKQEGSISTNTQKKQSDENFSSVRGSLVFLPTDVINITLRGEYNESETGGPFTGKLKNLEPYVSWWVPGYAPSDDIYNNGNDADHGSDIEDYGFSGHITIKLPQDITLRSVTGFRKRDQTYSLDIDRTYFDYGTGYNHNDIESFSQELQLDATMGKIDWIFGVNYYKLKEGFDQIFPIMGWPPPGTPGYFGTSFVADDTHSYADAYAAFANIGFQLTEKWKLGFGLRYSYEEKSVDGIIRTDIGVIFNDITAGNYNESWDAWTPKFIAEYQISDDMMAYGTIAQGFRAGLIQAANTVAPTTVDPEFVLNLEAGLKSDWLDKRLRANMSVFWMDYTDMQFDAQFVDDIGVSRMELQNAASAKIWGLELELTARPIQGLTLNTVMSYLNTEYGSFITSTIDGLLVDPEGNQLISAPEWKFSIGAQYTKEIVQYGFLTFRGDLGWGAKYYSTVFEDPESMSEASTYIQGLVRFETIDGRWSLDLYGSNLGEEDARWSARVEPGNGVVEGAMYGPIFFGAQLTFKY